MNYVLVAYALTILIIGGFALSIVVRRRQAERALEAWSELDDSIGPESDPDFRPAS